MCLPFYIITLEKKVGINSGLFVNLERIWYVKEKISYIQIIEIPYEVISSNQTIKPKNSYDR